MSNREYEEAELIADMFDLDVIELAIEMKKRKARK